MLSLQYLMSSVINGYKWGQRVSNILKLLGFFHLVISPLFLLLLSYGRMLL